MSSRTPILIANSIADAGRAFNFSPRIGLADLFRLFEVVYNDFGEKRLALFHKFQVLRMILVLILSLFALELNVQRDLICLVHHIPMASRHLTDMKIHNAGD